MKKYYKIIAVILLCGLFASLFCGCINVGDLLSSDVSHSNEASSLDSASLYSEGFKYKVNPGVKSCTITGVGTCKDTVLNIPPEIDGYVVTAVGGLFNSNRVTEVIIPNSVTKIENSAFASCVNLTSVIIPNSVTEIGNNAFDCCSSLTGITIPDSVTTIGGSAFSNCKNLTSITIPNSITEISVWMFAYCENLSNITIPASITKIDLNAFIGCKKMSSIIIPDSVTYVGSWAFSDCTSLADVYYAGSEEDWENISIGSYNEYLTETTIHYNYEK